MDLVLINNKECGASHYTVRLSLVEGDNTVYNVALDAINAIGGVLHKEGNYPREEVQALRHVSVLDALVYLKDLVPAGLRENDPVIAKAIQAAAQ